jgi:hypothetical protein
VHRLLFSVALVLLLVVSLAIKFSEPVSVNIDDSDQDESSIVSFLNRRGFAVTAGESARTPLWISGVRGTCVVRIATVSPQGWHRAVVAQTAAGQLLAYAYAGQIYDEQPILRTTWDYYVRRLRGHFRMQAQLSPVRAVIIAPECAASSLNPGDLKSLSE